MNRRYTPEEYAEKVRMIRSAFPSAAVTTDIIAGFPTETEEDFEESLAFAERMRFASVHCFPYSRRTGTVAAKLPDLPPEIKSDRLHRLLRLSERLRAEYAGGFVGKELEFVPEEEADGYTVGYSENYIRLYVPGKIEKKTRVIAAEPYKDGLSARPAEAK